MTLVVVALLLLYVNVILGSIFTYCLRAKQSNHVKTIAHSEQADTFKQRLLLIFFNIFTLSVVTAIGLFLAYPYFSLTMPTSVTPFALQLLCYFVFDDLWFYCWHRCLHKHKFLLRNVHRIHHQAKKPFPLEFMYVHPLEWMGGTLGILAACVFIYLIFGYINAYPFWMFAFFRSAHEILIHSGTESKIVKYLPFFLTNEAHSLHHACPSGNYASMFNYLDKLFKTRISGSDSAV